MTAINASMTSDQDWLPLSEADARSIEPGLYTIGSESVAVGGLHLTRPAHTEDPPNGRWLIRAFAGSTAASHDSGASLTRYFPDAPGGAGGGGGVTVTVPPADPVAVTNITLPGGSVIDGTATPGVIVSDTEPEPGAGQFWLRQINDGNSYQLYVRNADDDAWMLASAGIGSGDYGDGFADAGDRQVGYFNLESGSVNGLEVQSAPDAEAVYLRAIKADGSASKQIRVEPTRITIPGSNVLTFGLPTSDPLVAGQLFTDGAPSANTPKALMVSGGS